MTAHKAAHATLAVLTALSVASCTSLPGDGSPQVLRSYQPALPSEDNASPVDGREPDLLLRDFFAACGRPTGGHQVARSYLTTRAAESWNDAAGTTVVDRIDINAQAGGTDDKITYVIRGGVIGALGTGGTFTPKPGETEAIIELVKVDGQWRIDSLPQGVLLERTELQNNFSPQNLFFFDSTGRFLVRDRRWVYTRQPQLDTALISLLMEGPKGLLAPGVETAVPPGATLVGYDGAYKFSGFGNLSPEARHKFAAQVIWTLAKGGITGPYRIELDGAPIDPNVPDLDVEDVAEFNPSAASTAVAPLYALSNGSLVKAEGDSLVPEGNGLGSSGKLQSAAVSVSGELSAGVLVDGADEAQRSTLLVGPPSGGLTDVLQARTLTSPSFEYDAIALWTVSDGRAIVRIARSTTTGEMTQQAVQVPFLDEDEHRDLNIDELKLSPAGVRAAMIIDGNVYVGTVSRPGPGERRMDNVVQVAPAIGASAVSIDWMHDGSIIVGTSEADTPVWRVEPDGSGATPLPSGNITAPVTAVATSSTTLFITDARAALQLPINSNSSAFWREVPSLVGTRATPIVGS
ncbi:MtrAB system accessory lipoprotein LpqB [Corynebacterium aquilae]|uniref:Lipoprotein LpqB n=1 Tax=Corynebacterium aquilae DSM 44791 TaxID=1431546 RepID=A0A1L7CEJ8_9CORY|nr:MtrAB system accessory lipoprotein LpqB [Corynebacterium aquilae]APT84193.1 lipoprotein LpqB [Corynebacterium aquilae DSM 44791]